MPRLAEVALFFREFVRNFHTTGAILPSGRRLAAALSCFVAERAAGSRSILEVGPGTGAVTTRIIADMGPDDLLDLVELNDSFVERLNARFRREAAFQAVAARARVLHCPVQELPDDKKYDVIVSGLPLNNFSVVMVEEILSALMKLLKPGGTLSFFEYIAIRHVRTLVSGPAERRRLRGIDHAMQAVFDLYEIRRDAIWRNTPPAWVHHVQKPR
jgi:phosphatidylethanolamine/phosphatidyl-N-methylethanolamine N-methyltransferase